MATADIVTSLSHQDFLADWLVSVAGRGPQHLVMLPSGADKYAICDGSVTREMVAAHLDGEVCLGAMLIGLSPREEITTRAIVIDADNPAEWARLRTIGEQLAASGARVCLEQSPVRQDSHAGGGHLWIVFNAEVSADAALATAWGHARRLSDFWEYWPRCTDSQAFAFQAIRLPGGRYRRGKTDAWCELSAHRDPLRERVTGWAAIRKLVCYQTPAAWVTASPPARSIVMGGLRVGDVRHKEATQRRQRRQQLEDRLRPSVLGTRA